MKGVYLYKEKKQEKKTVIILQNPFKKQNSLLRCFEITIKQLKFRHFSRPFFSVLVLRWRQ